MGKGQKGSLQLLVVTHLCPFAPEFTFSIVPALPSGFTRERGKEGMVVRVRPSYNLTEINKF